MAVNKKGMRKVNYKGRPYFWSVQQQADDRWVRIIDSKKQFIVKYRIPQPEDEFAILINEGATFPQKPDAKEVQVPRWKHDTKRFPTGDFVRRLIDWCMSV